MIAFGMVYVRLALSTALSTAINYVPFNVSTYNYDHCSLIKDNCCVQINNILDQPNTYHFKQIAWLLLELVDIKQFLTYVKGTWSVIEQ